MQKPTQGLEYALVDEVLKFENFFKFKADGIKVVHILLY